MQGWMLCLFCVRLSPMLTGVTLTCKTRPEAMPFCFQMFWAVIVVLELDISTDPYSGSVAKEFQDRFRVANWLMVALHFAPQ